MRGLPTRAVRTLRRDGPFDFIRNAARYATERRVAPLFTEWAERAVLDRHDLRELAECEETFFERYDGGEQYTVAPPETCPPSSSPRGPVGVHLPPPFVCEIPNVDLVGPQALPVRDGRVIYENMLRSPRRVTMAAASALSRGRLSVQCDGSTDTESAAALVGPWDDNFFHWFADYLPRLEGLVYYSEQTGNKPLVFVPPDPPAWLCTSLQAVGLESERLVPWHGGRTKVERLVVPSIRREGWSATNGRSVLYSPSGFQWIAGRIRHGIKPPSHEYPERIYVSRQDATMRRVDNERAVIKTLSHQGFERVVLSELPFAAQVMLFAGAEAVVAPHGAGLVNMMFAEDLNVIELVGAKLDLEKWGPFHLMADTLGFQYGCVVGEQVGCDLRVDTGVLANLVDRMVAE